MGGSLLYLRGTTQGCKCGKGKSKPKTGLRSLGQGSWIRAWNGEGWAGSRCGVLETETKVCGGMGYMVEDFRSSLGRGDVWIGVLVRCYMECNSGHVCTVGLVAVGFQSQERKCDYQDVVVL